MKHIKKITHYSVSDPDFESDPMSVELFIDDVLVKEGDDYHDKIDDHIDGFMHAVKYFNIEHSYTESEVADFDE